jgi:hypothetical protein
LMIMTMGGDILHIIYLLRPPASHFPNPENKLSATLFRVVISCRGRQGYVMQSIFHTALRGA